MESTTNNVNNESFYGVFMENDHNESGRFSSKLPTFDNNIVNNAYLGTPKVFTEFKETLSAAKSNKNARFKQFKSATEAEHFSMFGHESPVKQVEKHNVFNVSTSFSFKSLKSEDLVAFRRLIEGGELDKVKQAVNSNPRFLVSSGDTPSIIQEGCRYNAMHVAARYNQPAIVHFIMESVTSSDFIQSLYGMEQSYVSRSEIITDLYLNTPDKAANDTPLHIASKFGHVGVVKELVSYDKCLLTVLNKYGQTPKDVICSRKNKEKYNDIFNLLENGYFVPMWKSDDECVQPSIGKPFSPKSSKIFLALQGENSKSLNPVFTIQAMAGPMSESQAEQFRRDWKSPVRKFLLSPSPKKCVSNPKSNELKNKSIEKAGRDLAEKKKVGWAEYWSFLNEVIDLKSDKGLDLLEKYLRQRFSTNEEFISEKLFTPEPTILLSPMDELCKALESMRIKSTPKEKSHRQPTLVSSTCIVNSCKVLGERLAKVIISECKEMQDIGMLANRLCHEVRHLLLLEDSFYSDSRFDSNIQGKIHGRVAVHLCQLLINNFGNVDISSVITKLQKHFSCHAIGSRNEITVACLVSFTCNIFTEKSFITDHTLSTDNEESCKQWFLDAVPCLCNIETNTRLKPKQLFSDDKIAQTPDKTEESKSNTLDGKHTFNSMKLNNIMEESLNAIHERRESLWNGYNSDEEIFSSAPTSPYSECSSSDESNMFFNAEHDFSYLLFSRDLPTNNDYEIFEVISCTDINSDKYPWVFRWLYSMNDYYNVNSL